MAIDPNDPLLTRDWTSVAAAKTRRWLAVKRAGGPAAGIAMGEALREHARALRPGGPTPEQRAADVANHARVSRLLARVHVRGR